MIGTPFDYVKEFSQKQGEGILWYLENCEMSVLDLYRALWQMKMAGWFEHASGVLLGRTSHQESVGDFSYEDVLHQIFDDLNIPVVFDVDFGHVAPQWTMVNGAFAKFTYQNGKGTLKSMLE